MENFKINQKIVSALGNPMIVTKIKPTLIVCRYTGGNGGWTMYKKTGRPYMALVRNNEGRD